MKLLGKTRSGKSTALYRLISQLVPLHWSKILILDGKRNALSFTATDPRVTYLNNEQIDRWAAELDLMADQLTGRYAQLDAGAKPLPTLIIADEIQVGTRHAIHKKTIKESLILLAEQSAALGDCMILSSHRQQSSIPPGVTVNCNISMNMLGYGYFHFAADGERGNVGRVALTTIQDATAQLKASPTHTILTSSATLTPTHLHNMLGSQLPQPTDGRLTLYTGETGSGLTHALQAHKPNQKQLPIGSRSVYIDLAAHSHKTAVESILTQCGGIVPSRTNIGDLTDMAAIALSAEPTLLTIDNAHTASCRTHASIAEIYPYATETAVSYATPIPLPKQTTFNAYLSRSRHIELKKLTKTAVHTLANQHLDPAITNGSRLAALAYIQRQAHGHPKTAVMLAQNIEQGTLKELQKIETETKPGISLLWLVIVFAVALLMAQHALVDSYTVTIILFAGYLILRPFVSRMVRDAFPITK